MHDAIRNLRCTASLAVILLAGCAADAGHPTLVYPPATQSAAQSTDAQPASKNKQIILNPFVDQRADKQVVGKTRSGFGARTDDVTPTNSVPDWVMHALKTELQHGGYVVTTGSAATDTLPGASAVVTGEIRNVYCDFRQTGKVSLHGKVKKAGKDVLNKSYAGEGPAATTCGRTADSYSQSLALALASAVKQFVAEIDRTLTTP